MSFKDFKNDLLVAVAVISKAQPTFEEEAIEIARIRKLKYRNGWLRQAVQSLEEQGLIKVSYHLGGGEDLGMPITITGDGIEAAEEIADANGYDLYEEITESENAISQIDENESNDVPASDRTVRLDHNSAQYKQVTEHLDTIKQHALTNNLLREKEGIELDQKIAEIEAGKILLNAPQTNADYAKKLLISAIKWIGEKIVDNVVAVIVAPLIVALLALLGF